MWGGRHALDARVLQYNWNGSCGFSVIQYSGSVFLAFIFVTRLAAAGGEIPAALPAKAFAPAIVIGFVGGRVAHNNAAHSEFQLARRLRQDYPEGVDVILYENRRSRQAHQQILRLLDVDHSGTVSAEEKLGARIAIYGHSWGASETVTLARALGKEGIPVLLTVQVDSIRKPGENDESIPANVAQAVNFYQRQGLFRGRSRIRAADASRTEILGNFQLDYRNNLVDLGGYPWYARAFMKSHIEIESDPSVWGKVESLIRSKLLPAGASRSN